MRILIAPNGRTEIISLSTSPSPVSTKLNFFKKRRNNNSNNSNRERRKENLSDKKQYINSPKTERKSLINIKVRQPRGSTLLHLQEIYEKPNNLKETIYHRIKTSNQIRSFSLYDLMNKNAYNDLLNNMKRENDSKEKDCIVSDFRFRNHSTLPFDIPKIINKVKNLKIQSNQYNLIQYLKGKDKFNPVLVKNYSNFNEKQIEKDNKFCKVILNNKKKDLIYKRIAEKKIKLKYNDYDAYLRKMKKDIIGANEIIKKYNVIKNNKALIKQNFEDFKRTYWNNLNFEHYKKKDNWAYDD